MAYPNSTGPLLESKSEAKDKTSNTSAYWNGYDANDHKTHLDGLSRQHVGSYRGYVSKVSATAVYVHTVNLVCDGYFKTLVSAHVVLPFASGTYYVYGRGNVTGAAAEVVTAATGPAPYASATRDFPIARCVVHTTTPDCIITHIRPDWILGWGL